MPYLKQESKDALEKDPGGAKGFGDFNYLFTEAMILYWSKKDNQKYASIHELKKASLQPSIVAEVMEVESLLTIKQVPMEDRKAARELAFLEFYRRVGVNYENRKATENGDVYKGVPHAVDIAGVLVGRTFTTEEVVALDAADHDADQEIGVTPVHEAKAKSRKAKIGC